MNFVKIGKEQLSFELTENTDTSICVEVTIPAYGHYKRGAIYEVEDISKLIFEQLKNHDLKHPASTGRIKAIRDETRKICLIFEKNISADSPKAYSSTQKKKTKNKKTEN